MAKTGPFDDYSEEYDQWFEEHKELYEAELKGVAELLSESRKDGLEIGVGSGKFAGPLGVPVGLEPSEAMAERASALGIEVHRGVAEALPFPDESFAYALMVVTICFVDDPLKSLEEAFRVLRPGGAIVIGFVDRNSEIGRAYESRKETSLFYRDARFHATEEVLELLSSAGFVSPVIKQTLLPEKQPDLVIDGYGQGSFVIIRALKPE